MTIKPIDTLEFLLARSLESQSRDNPYAAALKLINNLGSDLLAANMRAVNNAVRLDVLVGIVRAAIESLDSGDIYTSRSRAAVDSLRDAIGIVQHEKEDEEV